MEIKKMLFVTDFEGLWFDALRSLMALREVGLDHVVLLHVIERKIGYYTKEEKARLKAMAEVRFVDWAQSIYEEGMECGSYIVVGDTVSKIQEAVEEEGVDLVVINRQKRTKMEKFYVDSKTIEFLRKTPAPVLVHKYRAESGRTGDKLFERPLLAMDWSPPATRALEFLVGLKSIMKKLLVVQVVTERGVEGLGRRGLQKMEREHRKRLDDLCNALEGEGIEAEAHFYIGDVNQIQNAAREYEATLVATGTTGKSAWQARWLRSVSQELAELSELPTLLVP
ncbi:MAG: universal stress protein [Deltaproteobacteria bacterium]|nr:universal stress protein [Deltaproteobacteria bacterium]MBW2340836.1 universal stress protein [Deltaproteobacteria bacterium]